MQKLKITDVQNDETHCHITCGNWEFDLTPSFMKYAKVGGKLHVHNGKSGEVVAFSSENQMYFRGKIDSVQSAKNVLDNIDGKIAFNIDVVKSLMKHKIQPTLSAIANLVMLNNR